ncbi:hypothetical protein QBC44DRAFT_360766 [Cladorrhinum sp. PSN332]|nr:hypothetical protein QBC44DRAFT_360766 [Cladorrhinum sp. PSN332]
MFRAISLNLDSLNGPKVFVGITHKPAPLTVLNDTWGRMVNSGGAGKWGPVSLQGARRIESGEGWKVLVQTEMSPAGGGDDKVRYETYVLSKEAYEEAARSGGMGGGFEWRDVVLPGVARESRSETFWREYFDKGLHMGLMVVKKG